ncbi:hypothetical protein [Mongoliimonas terrestris]|uniref:hypothetical protein n=1 Tax=Mongoliimonas terrestris TaxID=1709001 RepID=UPI00094986DD|nr:hypothetical protein [Mongoliimonas terrestris]
MDNRRTNLRKRTLKGGKIVFGDFRYTFDCVVRDVSDEGARLKCDHVAETPDTFYLFDPSDHSLRHAVVRWRTEREIGIVFDGAPIDIYASNDPRLARFRHL